MSEGPTSEGCEGAPEEGRHTETGSPRGNRGLEKEGTLGPTVPIWTPELKEGAFYCFTPLSQGSFVIVAIGCSFTLLFYVLCTELI